LNDGGFDPRCRPWWNSAYYEKEYLGKTFVGEPYNSDDGEIIYVSMIQEMRGIAGAVNAMDLDMSNKFYRNVITKHFELLETKYVLATEKDIAILADGKVDSAHVLVSNYFIQDLVGTDECKKELPGFENNPTGRDAFLKATVIK